MHFAFRLLTHFGEVSNNTFDEAQHNDTKNIRNQSASPTPFYAKAHGIVCLLVCIFGSIANTLNIVVLTRREMRSPTNAILTGLAIADLLVMLDYMPYAINSIPYLRLSREERLTYGWAWYIMFHSIFAQICHTISIWLT
uniref:G-protein coupled receptors family 1 profile domain-containing protein n=1 Tax=Anopheles maculatus TaxID=74869 RepID=A0A182T4S1_9DIPT